MRKENAKMPWTIHPMANKEAMVTGENYRFTVLTECLIRMEYRADGQFIDAPTQSIICRDFPSVKYRLVESDGKLEIVTDKLHLYYDKKPFTREGLSIQLTEGYAVYGSVWHFGDEPSDLGGTAQTLDNVDGAMELGHGLMSRDGFTVLDDSAAAVLTEDGWVRPADGKGIDLYFFGYGHDYRRCLNDFYRLSGETPLLPRYTLGNWWSRFYDYTEQSYMELMNKFEEKQIPLSVAVIDMGWHLTDIPKRYGSGWTGYTWNPEFFPEPKRFMEQLHQRGMQVTLNVHPADGVRAHEEQYLEMAKELGIDYENEDKISFDVSDRPFMEAYFKYLHHPHEENGVDFWWLDWQQGNRSGIEGVDTLWLLNHLHFLDSARNEKRPLTFSRYAGIGSHRYPIGFSGDTISSWASLDFQPYFTANASNVGYSWWSHDIGGHQKGIRDDEMVVRWIQFGVFSPIMRLHSTSSEFYGKEPWNYNLIAEGIITRYMQLRHQLIPYLYSQNYQTHANGIPLIQPIYYKNDVDEAYSVPNEYYFGEHLIVCPITTPMDKGTCLAEFKAWIPEGRYYDLFTGQLYTGNRRVALYRNLENIPVLVQAGAIIPMAEDYMECHHQNPEQLSLHVFYGADGEFAMYEDDCSEMEDAKAVMSHFSYRQENEELEFKMEIQGESAGIIPARRSYQIHFRGVEELAQVTVQADQPCEHNGSYDSSRKEYILNITGENLHLITVSAKTSQEKPVQPDKMKFLFEMLQRAQIEYDYKDRIYRVCQSKQTVSQILASLYELNLEAGLYGAILEILTSNK